MNKLMAYLFLFSVPILAMDCGDDVFIKICALGDNQKEGNQESLVALLPKRLGVACEVIDRSFDFQDLYEGLLEKEHTFYVAPEFASIALWEKLKPCIEHATILSQSEAQAHIKELLKTEEELRSILTASSYLEHKKLYECCISEWVARDYPIQESDDLPQEIEAAIATALLAKYELHNKLISIAVEKMNVPLKIFRCKNGSSVWACAIGRNGEAVAAGRSDGIIHYWRKKGKKWRRRVILAAHTIDGDDRAVGRVQFIENNTKLISSGEQTGVKIWNLQTGKCVKSFGQEECNGFFSTYDEARGLLAIPTKLNGINIYNVRADDVPIISQCYGHHESIYALDFSPCADLLVSAGSDSVLALWNIISGKLVHYFDLGEPAFSTSFNRKGTQIAAGINHGGLEIYDAEKLFLVSERKDAHEHNSRIWRCCFSQDDTLLVTGAEDRKIKIWALPGLECLRVIQGDWGNILFMDQESNRNQFLAAFGDGRIGIMDLAPFMREVADQRNFLKNGLKLAQARFWVQASQATKENPLICKGLNGKIFSSFTAASQDQLVKCFHIAVPDNLMKAKQPRRPGNGKKPTLKGKK